MRSLPALPIHPVLVHFPVALFTISFGLVHFRYWRGRSQVDDLIDLCLAGGVIALPLVILAGLRDAKWFELFNDVEWGQPLIWHFVAAMTTAAMFTTYLFWRRAALKQGTLTPLPDIGFVTISFWMLLLTGLIGGEMVFG